LKRGPRAADRFLRNVLLHLHDADAEQAMWHGAEIESAACENSGETPYDPDSGASCAAWCHAAAMTYRELGLANLDIGAPAPYINAPGSEYRHFAEQPAMSCGAQLVWSSLGSARERRQRSLLC
jgi:hypothetical protein